MFSSTEMLLLIASIIFPLLAQGYLWLTFASSKKVMSHRGLTGLETAKEILKANGLANEVNIIKTAGSLSDYYNPLDKTLALSESVYGEKSIAAVAVAAHEVGHAIQHKIGYKYLVMRTTLYPIVGFASNVAPFLIIAGIIFSTIPYLLEIGIVFFTASVFFTIITLPVEFDASSRALAAISNQGLVTMEEKSTAKKVLNAAALTYVAAAVTAVLELVRLIIIARSNDN